MHTFRSSLRFKAGLAGIVAAVALALSLGGAATTHAQRFDGEFPRASLEFRTVDTLTVYAQADPASRVVATLAPFSVVQIFGGVTGKDGQAWAHLYTPDYLELGWAPFSKLGGASPIGIYDLGR